MRTWIKVVAGAALAAVAVPAQAQISVVPKIGFYSPAADLEAAREAAGEIVDERGGSLALGLAAELGMFRVGFDYVTASEFTWADTTGADVEASGEQTMLALTGDVILRPIPRILILEPYLLAGAGVKRYDFSFEDASGDTEIEEAFPESATDFTVHAGLGVDVDVGPIALVVELSDYVSWYEAEGADGSEMQNDLFIMAGVRVGIF